MSELDPESRELFRAGRDALRPSAGDRARIRDALRARIAGIPDASGHAAMTTPGSGLGWLSVSALATAVVVGGLLFVPKSETPQVAGSASASNLMRPAALPVPSSEIPPAPPVSAAPLPSPSVAPNLRTPAKPSRQTDSLAQEVALLSRAETELHAGRFAAALQLLNAHQRTFPRGILAQERVAARIQALCGLGRVKEANAELARVTPGSLHDGPTREACGRGAAK